ncbi:hypothetical protein Sjap_000385 [Stephania japonica]|uniref:RING-type E3 ubiquitin transferase n=1 Tax=Stephania japonica TaxID=461633 RepID=A0AAP0PSE3_9MAGN
MSRGTSDFGRVFTPPVYRISDSLTSTPGFHNHHHQVVGGNGGNSSIGINSSFNTPYFQSNFNARRRSFADAAAGRSGNSSSMYDARHANAAARFHVRVNQFHRRNNQPRPRYEIMPPRNRNNYLRRYEVPSGQQDSDLRRNETPPHFRNAPRPHHSRNFHAQPVTMRNRIHHFVVTLQDGVDIELTPEDYQGIRDREISRAREISYDRRQQMLLQRMLEEETREMSSGWTEEDILKCLKTRTNDASLGKNQKNTICTICQDEYEVEDKIGILNCGHEFHRDCIKDWLLRNSICPICRRPALDGESSAD